MPFLSLVILALVQGVTEFLPVSSSGHLVLTHTLLNGQSVDLCWSENRMIDVAVHVGTLASVLLYYRDDVMEMLCGFLKPGSLGQKLVMHLFVASLPAVGVGFILFKLQPSFVCLLSVMAWMTLILGIVLWIADKYFTGSKTIEELSLKDSILIGLAQALALVPGTSRSGITMTAALFLGYSRKEAAHFSLLLAIVAIAGAGTLSGIDLARSGNLALSLDALIAAVLAFAAGYGAIALMMKWLENRSFTPFAVYRIILGLTLLGLIYSGAL